MYSAFANVKNGAIQQLLPGTKRYQNDIRCLPESWLKCDSGSKPPMAIGAPVLHGYRQDPI
jgi:hypothetical protein